MNDSKAKFEGTSKLARETRRQVAALQSCAFSLTPRFMAGSDNETVSTPNRFQRFLSLETVKTVPIGVRLINPAINRGVNERKRYGLTRAVLALSLLLFSAVAQLCARETGGKLICALDKENLPYSSRRADPPGLDAEIAQEIAKTLDATLEIRWIDTMEDGLLSPLLEKGSELDFTVGAAIEPRAVEESRRVGEEALYSLPYASARYILVSLKEERDLQNFEEVGRTPVGVEVGSVAEHELWNAGFLLQKFGAQDRILNAICERKVAYGLLWPNAGWAMDQDAKLRDALKIQVVKPTVAGMEWNLALAVSKAKRELLPRLDGAVLRMKKENRFRTLFDRYKMPYFEPFQDQAKSQ